MIKKMNESNPVQGDNEEILEDEVLCEEDEDEEDELPFEPEIDPRETACRVLVWVRYLMPALIGFCTLLFGAFYWVHIALGTSFMELSTLRLYGSSLNGALQHFATGGTTGQNWFYGLTAAGAVVGILLLLTATALAVLAGVTAIRAFRAGFESNESNKMKVLFRVPFANRAVFWLYQLLFLLPLLYPEYVAAVGQRLMLGGVHLGDVLYIVLNRPLIIVAVLCLVSLILGMVTKKLERKYKMDMFELWFSEPTEEEAESEEDEE